MKFIYQVFSFDVLSRVLIGLIGLILIRVMEESEYALYTFAFSIITISSQMITSTFKRIYIIGYESFNLDKYKESFLGLQVIIIFIISIVFIPFYPIFNSGYVWIIAMILGFVLVEYIKTIFQNEQKFIYYSIIEVSRSGLFFLVIIIFIYFYRDNVTAWQIFMIQSLTMIGVFLIYRGKLNFKNIIRIREAMNIGKRIFVGSYKYLIGYTLLLTVLGQLDILMLKVYSSEGELATYGSAFRYYTLISLALTSINAVFLPAIQSIKKRIELDRIYNRHIKLLFFIIPIILVGAWLSKWIIPIIDMGKYPDAITVFQILSFSIIISFVFSPYANLVMKFEKFKFLFNITLISIFISIIINLFTIPVFGSIGAAFATLVAFAFNNIITFIYSQKCIREIMD